MFALTIQPFELYNEATGEFSGSNKPIYLELEYSLDAIMKWETKYCKQWIQQEHTKDPRVKKKQPEFSNEEITYLIKCMATNVDMKDIDDEVFLGLRQKDIEDIFKYMQSPQSAIKKIPETKSKGKKDPIPMTSDRVEAWMVELQMPWEYRFINFNRLLTLIQIINYDNTPDDKKKKTKASEVMKNWNEINDKRLAELGTKG